MYEPFVSTLAEGTKNNTNMGEKIPVDSSQLL